MYKVDVLQKTELLVSLTTSATVDALSRVLSTRTTLELSVAVVKQFTDRDFSIWSVDEHTWGSAFGGEFSVQPKLSLQL
eukprot:SAG31_NODE_22318_length_528_cov_1.079254_1_plen_79_part_00